MSVINNEDDSNSSTSTDKTTSTSNNSSNSKFSAAAAKSSSNSMRGVESPNNNAGITTIAPASMVMVQRVPLKAMTMNSNTFKAATSASKTSSTDIISRSDNFQRSDLPRGTINLASIEGGSAASVVLAKKSATRPNNVDSFGNSLDNQQHLSNRKAASPPSSIFHWTTSPSPLNPATTTKAKRSPTTTQQQSQTRQKKQQQETLSEDMALMTATVNSAVFSLAPSSIFANPTSSAASANVSTTTNNNSSSGSCAANEQKSNQHHASDDRYTKDSMDGAPARPPYSYASLIAQAINSSDNGRMKLNDIYAWIIDTYPYYKFQNSGWQNSIRHNLSLNKSFVKVANPSKESGKGSYWQIAEQDQEFFDVNGNFKKRRKSISGGGPNYQGSGQDEGDLGREDDDDDYVDNEGRLDQVNTSNSKNNYYYNREATVFEDDDGMSINPSSLNNHMVIHGNFRINQHHHNNSSNGDDNHKKSQRRRRKRKNETPDDTENLRMSIFNQEDEDDEDDEDQGEENDPQRKYYLDENFHLGGRKSEAAGSTFSRNNAGNAPLTSSARYIDSRGNLMEEMILTSYVGGFNGNSALTSVQKPRRRSSVDTSLTPYHVEKSGLRGRRKSLSSSYYNSNGTHNSNITTVREDLSPIPAVKVPVNPLSAIMAGNPLLYGGTHETHATDATGRLNDKKLEKSDGGIEWPLHVEAMSQLVNSRSGSLGSGLNHRAHLNESLTLAEMDSLAQQQRSKPPANNISGGGTVSNNSTTAGQQCHQHIYHFSSNNIFCGSGNNGDEGYGDSLPSTRRSMTPFDEHHLCLIRGSPNACPGGIIEDHTKDILIKRRSPSSINSTAASPHTMLLSSSLLSCPELFDMTWPWMETSSSSRQPNQQLQQNPKSSIPLQTIRNTNGSEPKSSDMSSDLMDDEPTFDQQLFEPAATNTPTPNDGTNSNPTSDENETGCSSRATTTTTTTTTQSVAMMMRAMQEEMYGSSLAPDYSMFYGHSSKTPPPPPPQRTDSSQNTSMETASLAFLEKTGSIVIHGNNSAISGNGISLVSSSTDHPTLEEE